MTYLKKIVDDINCELERALFSSDKYNDRKVVGIAESMPRKTQDGGLQVLPSYIGHNGEGQYVGPEDHYDLIIYHRVNSLQEKTPTGKVYGDGPGYTTNIAGMSMVVFGRRDKLRMTNDEMALLLQANFPPKVQKSNINVSDIDLNTMQVFQEEFQGFAFFLKPEQFLFKLNYTIESTYLKKCFSNC